MYGVHYRLHLYPVCGIFYFPWHSHQIEALVTPVGPIVRNIMYINPQQSYKYLQRLSQNVLHICPPKPRLNPRYQYIAKPQIATGCTHAEQK